MSRRSPESSETPDHSEAEEAAPPAPLDAPVKRSSPSVTAMSNVNPMLRDKRIRIIAAGALGPALLRGLMLASAALANRILVSDPHVAHVQNLQNTLGVKRAESNAQVAKYTDIVILAVKPYTISEVLDEICESLKRDGGKPLPLLLSIAAG